MAFKSGLGYLVTSAQLAVAAAPDNIFAVTGTVIVTALWSVIAVESGANACNWQYQPTAGTANQAMCAVGDINVGVIGDIVCITETAGVRTLTTGGDVGMLTPCYFILPPGNISFDGAAADGELVHNVLYIPISAGARITLAP